LKSLKHEEFNNTIELQAGFPDEKTLQLYMNVNINVLNILLNCSSAFSNPELSFSNAVDSKLRISPLMLFSPKAVYNFSLEIFSHLNVTSIELDL
jgi:hypothetical protein